MQTKSSAISTIPANRPTAQVIAKPETAIQKKAVELTLSAPEATSVKVAGSFNEWSLIPMHKTGDRWKAALSLPSGKYEYRFVVDGEWLSDPAARESRPNNFGSENSVIKV